MRDEDGGQSVGEIGAIREKLVQVVDKRLLMAVVLGPGVNQDSAAGEFQECRVSLADVDEMSGHSRAKTGKAERRMSALMAGCRENRKVGFSGENETQSR